MFNTEVLREKILLLAMQGKLVQQKAIDGTARDLLKYIKDERIQQACNKKIKTLPSITSDQMIFDIPKTWEWVHVGDIFKHSSGKALNSKNTEGHLLSYITTSNLYWNRFVLDELREMYYKDSELEKCTAHKGDLLVCEGGDIGRAAIWPYEYDIRIQNHIHKLTPYGSVSVKFYYYCFYLYKKLGLIGGKGIALQGLSANALAMLVFPLPPVPEQIRIVEKIEEVFDLLEKLDKSVESYEQEKIKLNQKILEVAIQGKLVEQRAEEGSAEELYNLIQIEKTKLIAKKIIKKDKVFEPISEDEILFDIPDSWKWVRLGEIFALQAGKNISASCIFNEYSSEHPYGCFGGNGIRGYVESSNRTGIHVLIGRQGALCGNVKLSTEEFYATEHAVVVDQYGKTNVKWAFYFLEALNLNQYATATAQPGLAVSKINNVLIPLPPYAEQERIVNKIEKLLPLCDSLIK